MQGKGPGRVWRPRPGQNRMKSNSTVILHRVRRSGNGCNAANANRLGWRFVETAARAEALDEARADRYATLVETHQRRLAAMGSIQHTAAEISTHGDEDYVTAAMVDMTPSEIRNRFPYATELVGLDGRPCWSAAELVGGGL